MSAKEAFRAMRQIYVDAIPTRTEYYRQMNAFADEGKAIFNSRALTVDGKAEANKARIEKMNRTQSEYKDYTARVLESIDAKASEIVRNYGGTFGIDPSTIDSCALELLKSGVLSDKELLQFGAKYAGNNAMTRIIGKYCADRVAKSVIHTAESDALKEYATTAAHAGEENPIINAAESIAALAKRCLVGGQIECESYANHFDEMFDEHMTGLPND